MKEIRMPKKCKDCYHWKKYTRRRYAGNCTNSKSPKYNTTTMIADGCTKWKEDE